MICRTSGWRDHT